MTRRKEQSTLMDELIRQYEARAVEAGCAPGSGRYGLEIEVEDDISPVFPYLNALLRETRYDHENRILIWREKDAAYALRPHEIKVARTEGIDDPARLPHLAAAVVERINSVWRSRGRITPRFTETARPPVFAIFRLLPGTNCKACGYATCLAYASALREGKAQMEGCSTLMKPEHEAGRRKLAGMFQATL